MRASLLDCWFNRLAKHSFINVTIYLVFCNATFAYDRTSEAGEAAIKDGTAECQAYGYPLVSNSLSTFPAIWHPASIVANDSAAWDKWNSISGTIPTTISIKGTLDGNFSTFTPTYPKDDPDCWWTLDQCVSPKLQGLPPDVFQVPEPNTLGYGFDDGPNCSHNAFYDYLSSQNQKATMFFIGSNVMNWPLEAQRAATDGHEICVHTWSHRYMTAFSSRDAFAELYYSIKAIKLVVGVTPTCWRPPFGDVDDRIRAIATSLGLRTILWGYDSNDWRAGVGNVTAVDVDTNYQHLIDSVNSGKFDNSGAIMLTHELNNFTMSEAVKFYPQLRASFKYIVPVGVALNRTHPYLERNYTLPAFDDLHQAIKPVPSPTVVSGNSSLSKQNAAMNHHRFLPPVPYFWPILFSILLNI
ncbi:hypothetical protein AX17_001757 [Amanita inopinata Kibby_2008]|nr:hypothetical protein AX17_001757 [Amanita inopinata Kibby_2008]